MTTRRAVRVGISGFRYGPWRGVFYPEDLPQRDELRYASRWLGALEINGTFYSLQRPERFVSWYEATPRGFRFAVKGPRYVTHMLRLRDADTALANFFASGVLALEEKLGPILWQLPPSMKYDATRLDAFLARLPHDTDAAARLARGREAHKMRGRERLRAARDRPIRHAIEVRHETFADARFLAQLRTHDVALVVAETAGKWPLLEDVTASFTYVRLHGARQLYRSGYTDAELDAWAARVRAWHAGREPHDARRLGPSSRGAPRPRDVYVFFDNTDVKLRAPFDALALAARLGVAKTPTDVAPPPALDTARRDSREGASKRRVRAA